MSHPGGRMPLPSIRAEKGMISNIDDKDNKNTNAEYFFYYNTDKNTLDGEETQKEKVEAIGADEPAQYVMTLEIDRKELEDENELLREKTYLQKSKLASKKRRIELLELALSKLSQSLEELQAQNERKILECSEKNTTIVELEKKVHELELGYQEIELARKNAMCKVMKLEHQVTLINAKKKDATCYRDGSFYTKKDPLDTATLSNLRHPEIVRASKEQEAVSKSSENDDSHLIGENSIIANGLDQSNLSIQQLEDVVVRLQVEMMRSRRTESLRKLILLRHSIDQRSVYSAFIRWQVRPTKQSLASCDKIHQITRLLKYGNQRRLQRRFHLWRSNVQLLEIYRKHQLTSSFWNRMLGAERLANVLRAMMKTRKGVRFHQWHAHIDTKARQEDMHPLKEEIRKLYEQLQAANSEAWDYKRQVLKQFLN